MRAIVYLLTALITLLILPLSVSPSAPIRFTIDDVQYTYFEADPASGERLSWVEAQRFCQRQDPDTPLANLAVFWSREHMRLVIAELGMTDPESQPWAAYQIDNSYTRHVMAPNNLPDRNSTFLPSLASALYPFQQPGSCGALSKAPGDDGLYSSMGIVQANCFTRGPWICQQPYTPCKGNPIGNRLTHRCRFGTNVYHTCLGPNLFLTGACPTGYGCQDCGQFVRASNDSFTPVASVCHMPALAPKC